MQKLHIARLHVVTANPRLKAAHEIELSDRNWIDYALIGIQMKPPI